MVKRHITDFLDALPWLVADGLLPLIVILCAVVLMITSGILGRTRLPAWTSVLGVLGVVLFIAGSIVLALTVGQF